jgi:acyl-coenzyme A synthetase/AMP-(fatty) acid ligase
MTMTLHGRLRALVARHPERDAVVHGERRCDYRELLASAVALAQLLRVRWGVRPGDVLAGWLDNGLPWVTSLLAAAEAGATFLPLNPTWRGPELRALLARVSVVGVLTRGPLAQTWHGLADLVPGERILDLEKTDPGACDAAPATTEMPDATLVMLCSSGSTGRPKLVPRSHAQLLAGARATGAALGLPEGLRFAGVVPFHHGNGLDNSLLLALTSGGTLFVHAGLVPARFAAHLVDQHIEALVGSPAVFDVLLRFGVDLTGLRQLRLCASSGGPLPEATARAVRERCGVGIREVYGSSETGVVAVAPPDGGPPSRLVPGTEVRILDGHGRPALAGATGEIAVRSAAVASGYLDDPAAAAAVFRDGWVHTGDRGRRERDGGLALDGRVRPQLNLSGTKVDATEIEGVLLALPGVRACRVLAESAAGGRPRLRAVLAVDRPMDRATVVEHCRRNLAEYKIPRVVETVDALPPDLTGKDVVPWRPDTA